MSGDQDGATGRAEFDAEHPVEVPGFPGHTVLVYRERAPRDDGDPRLVLEFDGVRYELRPARSYDTRVTVAEAALPLARLLATPDL